MTPSLKIEVGSYLRVLIMNHDFEQISGSKCAVSSREN